MDDLEKFDKETLPEKKEFYNNLNFEHILEEDYNHGKRIYRELEIKNLGKYHDLHLKSDVITSTRCF